MLGIRLAIEAIDADGEYKTIEATVAYVEAEDGPRAEDGLELRLDGDVPIGSVPLPVLWETLRLLDALPPAPDAAEPKGGDPR